MKYSSEEKLLWNKWRGAVPSKKLREALINACHFILDNEVELFLTDYTQLHAPALNDQQWLATHAAEILQHAKLKRVATMKATDVFQQKAIDSIYEKAYETPLPCETKDFLTAGDAFNWLLEEHYPTL